MCHADASLVCPRKRPRDAHSTQPRVNPLVCPACLRYRLFRRGIARTQHHVAGKLLYLARQFGRPRGDHTIVDTVRFFKERGHIVRFIEYMDVGNARVRVKENKIVQYEVTVKVAFKVKK